MRVLNESDKPLILVIDDQKLILELLKEILESNNYEVLIAETIFKALDIYRDNLNKIALVILDMQLFQVDYNFTIPALLEINPKVKIIAMSGNITLKDLPEQLRANVSGLLRKPFSTENLLTELRKIY